MRPRIRTRFVLGFSLVVGIAGCGAALTAVAICESGSGGVGGGETSANRAPSILSPPSWFEVRPGESMRLIIEVLDPDGDPCTIHFDATEPALSVQRQGQREFVVVDASERQHGEVLHAHLEVKDVDGAYSCRDLSVQVTAVPGAGTEFAVHRRLALPGHPIAVASGDVDGDGITDLVATTVPGDGPGGERITLFRGHGEARFEMTESREVTATHPAALLVVDLNGDDLDDVLCGGSADGRVLLLRAEGGGLLAPSLVAAYESVASLLALDADGDGRMDLAVSDCRGDHVHVLRSEGASLVEAYEVPLPGALGLAAADFDGDGNVELAVSRCQSTEVALYHLVPSPVLASYVPPSTRLNPQKHFTRLLVADLERDGTPGLLAFLGRDGAAYTPDPMCATPLDWISWYTGSDCSAWGAVDVDRDYFTDFCQVGYDDWDPVWYWHRSSNSYVETPVPVSSPFLPYADVAAICSAGIDADGNPLLVCAVNSQRELRLVSCEDELMQQHEVLMEASGVLAGDLDGDGDLDLLFRDDAHARVFALPNRNGRFCAADAVEHRLFTRLRDRRALLRDVNRDGFADLLLIHYNTQIFPGVGDLTFGPCETLIGECWAVTDIVGDDDAPDIAANNEIYVNDGNGNFSTQIHVDLGYSKAPRRAAEDMDGDGHVDIVVLPEEPLEVQLFRGDGTGSFTLVESIGIAGMPLNMTVAPLTEGALPSVWVLSESNEFHIFRNTGGTLEEASVTRPYIDSSSYRDWLPADLNRDGHRDLVYRCSGTIRVMPGRGDGSFDETKGFYVEGQGDHLAPPLLADLVEDERPELVLRGDASRYFLVRRREE